jgi:hypothetical protein
MRAKRKSVNWLLYEGVIIAFAGVVMIVTDKRKN